jgi:signal transduction histidine kinase
MAGVRERFGKWIRRGADPAPPKNPLLFADHEEIQDIARQMSRTKVELDRSILTLRSWARDLSRRMAESGGRLDQGHDLRSLGETVGGLAHNFNNSLTLILGHAELVQFPRHRSEIAADQDEVLRVISPAQERDDGVLAIVEVHPLEARMVEVHLIERGAGAVQQVQCAHQALQLAMRLEFE